MPETGGVPVTRTPMLMLLARNKQRQVRPCAARALRVLFPDGGLAYCACALWSAARVRDHAPLKRPVVQPRNGRRVNHGPNADFPPIFCSRTRDLLHRLHVTVPDHNSVVDNNTSVERLFSHRQTEYGSFPFVKQSDEARSSGSYGS
jgi:hypothetical protein